MIKMLTPTDSIKDRLASFYHWNDKQGLEQALAIFLEIPERIDLKEIERRSIEKNHLKNFKIFLEKAKNQKT